MKFQLFAILFSISAITLNFELQAETQLTIKTTQTLNDYTKCFEMVEVIAADVAQIIVDIGSKNIPDIIIKSIDVVKQTYKAIKCFEENSKLTASSFLVLLQEDKRQCYLSHIEKGIQQLQQFIKDITDLKEDEAEKDFKAMLETFKDALANC